MSKQDAFKFLDRMEKDAAFRDQLKNAKDVNDKKKLLHSANLNFTKQEVEDAWKEKYKQPLSAEQLKQIAAAGGRGIPQSFEQYKAYILSIALQ